uniref:Putative single-stranded dna-binding replication protein a rpa medium 30 kd subunit n=1 Tax=Triatoma dimidiata TaxID=72491 RepID=A0A0V0GBC5_TRIDM
MFSSPAPGAAGKSGSKSRALAPVAIKQILDCPEDILKISEIEVQVVKIVGIIKMVDIKSIKVSYIIEDPTGSIEGISYLESDTDTPESIIENTYCVMIGSVRSQSGSKHIMIFNIYPVTDFNEIIEHYLAVVYLPLKASTMDNTEFEQKPIKQEMLSSYGSANEKSSDMNYFDMDPKFRRVYEIISKSQSESGISMDEIFSSTTGKMPRDQIRSALEYLVGEGHIFTTIDENHFKSTESPF